ncbi:type II toxin-antitoxin system HipA family toxin [Nocardioides sp. W7]|uniref:type II toxin-antitoxin system HipA family toxin n=1 Tax=Nocardioides sp. W7 TaxID=2931390 RepID=UPI001FD105F5|nr:type II toxin-antitoxin system HipA family toxin [Nocardioides sp. W7]
MPFQHAAVIEVRYGDRLVGAVTMQGRTGAFQYDPQWRRTGPELAPFLMSHQARAPIFRFPRLSPETFHHLPPMLADSLPDRFGNALIDAWLATQGVSSGDITPLDRLAYVGDRAMGALAFRPVQSPGSERPDVLDLAELTMAARRAIEARLDEDGPATSHAVAQILKVGTSAGGARPKAVVNIDDTSAEITAGSLPPRDGESAWLLKFDGVTDARTLADTQQYTRIEYAYYLMALEAGITMTETKLLHENGRAHFLTRRFDRPGGPRRVHMATLCGMRGLDNDLVATHDYAQLFDTIRTLDGSEEELREAFRRMVFNVAAVNHDDHTKNHSFLLDPETHTWQLSPAYDLTYANVPGHPYMGQHCMGVGGVFAGITDEMMLKLADTYRIPAAKADLRRVREAVEAWPEFAAQAQVPRAEIEGVSRAHATLGIGKS